MHVLTIQLNRVLLDELSRHFDQTDIASQPAIVEPIWPHCRTVVGMSRVVNPNVDDVLTVLKSRSRLAIERREAAFVFAYWLLVQPDASAVVRRAEKKE